MNILLLEPNYTAKFPPLGLMKIASYHKHCRGDFVWFSKGLPPTQVSEAVRAKLQKSKYYSTHYDIRQLCEQANNMLEHGVWDRVYITTLFTYLEATEYLRDEGRAIITANEYLFSKLKSGEELTRKLRRMVDVYVVRKAYRPRCRPNVAAKKTDSYEAA